jgi:methionyl-tRNA synthetase
MRHCKVHCEASFQVAFDCFYSTNSPENRRHSEYIFAQLRQQGHIVTRPVAQYYCETDGRFLPDRFIRKGYGRENFRRKSEKRRLQARRALQ